VGEKKEEYLEEAELIRMRSLLRHVFTPSSPVSELSLFSGRYDQIDQVLDAVSNRGQHAIIYGERGVGKTSLATLTYDLWNAVKKDYDLFPLHITCDTSDTFQSLWFKISEDMRVEFDKRGISFPTNSQVFTKALHDIEHSYANPNSIRRFFDLLGKEFIITIDEFDRLQRDDEQTGMALFADTIKTLSDQAVPVTLIIVGVADSVDQLLREHLSISRALVQVQMPRMSQAELIGIAEKGYDRIGIAVDPAALDAIAALAQGLPHYAHVLALHAAEHAARDKRAKVVAKDVVAALQRALDQAHEDIVNSYTRATTASRQHIYEEVLLACALTDTDPRGFFAAVDVQAPMCRIMKRPYKSPSFARHLNDFCSDRHGEVLHAEGEKHKVRYRFVNPLLKPYALHRGLLSGLIDMTELKALEVLTPAARRRLKQP